MKDAYRGWINQPSTLQPLHHMHGQRCIVIDGGHPPTVRLYFTEGDIISMEALRSCVSRGNHYSKRGSL